MNVVLMGSAAMDALSIPLVAVTGTDGLGLGRLIWESPLIDAEPC
jgi:hypothetical protein